MAIGDSAGATLTFSGFTFKLTNMTGPGLSNNMLKTTNLATTTTYHTYISSDISESGQLSVDGWFDPTLAFPALGATGTATISWSGSTSDANWVSDALLEEFEPQVPESGNLKTMSATFKLTGNLVTT